MKEPPHPVLAQGKVRYVGDPVAVVVAETSRRPTTPPSWSRSTTRCCRPSSRPRTRATRRAAGPRRDRRATLLRLGLGDKAAVDAGLRQAPPTSPSWTWSTTGWSRTRWSRAPRSASTTGRRRATRSTPPARTRMSLRLLMGAFVLGVPEHKLRVVAPDVGGGFGSKIFHLRRGIRRAWAAKVLRPAGQVDRRALGELPLRRPRPRPRHPGRAGDGQGRQLPRAEGRIPPPTWAPISRPSRPACRPICTRTLLAGHYKTPAI